MSLYEFKCSKCNSVNEEIKPLGTTSSRCLHCGTLTTKIFSVSVGRVLNGTPKLTSTKLDKNVDRHGFRKYL
jgi:putative FmdB family regulatory protein